MSDRIAVDFGSRNTRLADASGRLLFEDETVAAVNLRDGSLVAFGSAARDLVGRSAGEVGMVRPVIRGQLQDLQLTDKIATRLLETVAGKVGRHPEVLCCVPGLATGVQKRAMERAFKQAGSSKVEFIDHAVATGIGFRLHIEEPVATMTLDAGAGTTDVAVMALGGTVTKASIPVGGDDIDRSIRQLLLRSFDLVVPSQVAEQVKKVLVTAWRGEEEKIEVMGRDASNGAARSVVISTSEASAVAEEHVSAMLEAAVSCIVSAPPDLANDLLVRGLHLSGEGALLSGFARKLASATGIPVHLAADPANTAVLGAARCLRQGGWEDERPAGRSKGARPADPPRPDAPASRDR